MLRARLRTARPLLLCAALAAVAPASALAQTAPRLVDPNRADQNPRGVLRRAPLAPTLPQERPANAPIKPFTLNAVEISGTSLPPETFRAAYAPFVGQRIDNPALTRLTEAVAGAYGRTTVALYTVYVPPQGFEGGVLKLQVVEGYVESVRFDGVSDGRLRRLLARYYEPVTRERPLRTPTLQKALSLTRDVPGLTVTASLERGERQGAVRIHLKATPHPVQGAFSFNNRGTALLGKDQVQADFLANGLLLAGDQLHLSVATPTQTRLFQAYGVSYAAPFDSSGGVAQATVSVLRTRPSFIPLKGDAVSFGLQASRPLLRSFTRNVYLTASLTGVNSDNALFGQEFSNERTRTLRLAASYSQSGAKNLLTASGTVSFGLDGLGARTFDPNQQQTDFKKFNAKVLDNLQLSRNIILRLDGFGQATYHRLPPSEQVALGGDELGRAYEAALISGDYGVAGSAEVAWIPAKGLPSLLKGSEAYVFADGGRTYFRSRNDAPTTHSDLASLGAGVRAQLQKRFVLQLEAARGLTNPVFYEDRRATRIFVSLRTIF